MQIWRILTGKSPCAAWGFHGERDHFLTVGNNITRKEDICMQHDLNSVQGSKLPPSVILQGAAQDRAGAAPKGGFMFLSAYALSLRDPALFAACYTVNPKALV